MHTLWVAHITKVLDDLPQDKRQGLLALLQKAEADWSKRAAIATEPAPGVIWDASRGRWRVRRQRGKSARVYGRFTRREDAEALAEAICAYERDNGHLPPAGWRG